MRKTNKGRSQQPKSKDELRYEHALRRKRQRKRRQRRVYSLMLLVLIGAGVALSLTVFFPLKGIAVEGNTLYQQQDIINISGLIIDENLFLSDTKRARASIEESLPYVGQALVNRKLPDKIVIEIIHTAPKYLVETGGQFVFLNENGKVLETGKQEIPEGMAIVKGVEAREILLGKKIVFDDDNFIALIKNIVEALEENEIQGITVIDLTDTLNITLYYEDRLELLLGTDVELEKKLELAKEVIDRQNSSNPKQHGKIDLSIIKKAYFSPKNVLDEETQPSTNQP